MNRMAFVVRERYGSVSITEIIIEKETEKTITMSSVRPITGTNYSVSSRGRINKKDHFICNTLGEAVTEAKRLVERTKGRIAYQITSLQAELVKLTAFGESVDTLEPLIAQYGYEPVILAVYLQTDGWMYRTESNLPKELLSAVAVAFPRGGA